MKVSKPDRIPKRKAPKSAFKPGPDPRRNMAGNLNAALQSYELTMRNAAPSKLGPEEFIEIIADEVRHHRPGAREFWGKYIVGEPTAKHEVNLKTSEPLLIKVVHVKSDKEPGNGSGNGGNGDKH